ncbi:MAG: 50S ribosome-binding GTPase [Candidatus Heimdallarchaeota archaeon]|nr:50S ribosome-binding GTPase [Candidatus Heimdallarchaeota archaeon]MCK5049656.1 50S ribosome-binding GTPase [Candidatus Heimdallarchaeota archaeon]
MTNNGSTLSHEHLTFLEVLKRRSGIGKILIVGESFVGKTSVLNVLLTGEPIDQATKSTRFLNLDSFGLEDETIMESTGYKVQAYDVAGQKRVAHAIDLLSRQLLIATDLIIYTFGLDDPQSLEKIDNWVNDVNQAIEKLIGPSNSIPAILVGNKKDLERMVAEGRPREVMQGYGFFIGYFETSSTTGEGFDELKSKILQALTVRDLPEKDPQEVREMMDE